MLSHAFQKKAVAGLTICFSITASAYTGNSAERGANSDPAASRLQRTAASALPGASVRYCPVPSRYADGFGFHARRTSNPDNTVVTTSRDERAPAMVESQPISDGAYRLAAISSVDRASSAAVTTGASPGHAFTASGPSGTRSTDAGAHSGPWPAPPSRQSTESHASATASGRPRTIDKNARPSPTATSSDAPHSSSPPPDPSASETPSSSGRPHVTKGQGHSDPMRPKMTDISSSGGSIEPIDSSRPNSHDRTGDRDLTNVVDGVFDKPKHDPRDPVFDHDDTDRPSLSRLPTFQTNGSDGSADNDTTSFDDRDTDKMTVDAPPADVPEPGSLGILALGLLAIWALARRRLT